MRISRNVSVALGAIMLVVTACGDDSGDGNAGARDASEFVSDGTFTAALSDDPGSLDPHMSAQGGTREVVGYLYDKLVYTPSAGEDSGEPMPWLAESWDVPDARTVVYTIREGVTCSDGSPLTAGDVAANYEFVNDPANESPLAGIFFPADLTASADDDARTVTLTTEEDSPFLLEGTGDLSIVCGEGLTDRSLLVSGSVSTGMFHLVEVVPNDHYTFERRDDYEWGPRGGTASDAGTPKTITLRVVTNESTVANLFLTGELNVASITGPDRARLEQSGSETIVTRSLDAELFFNQAEGRPGTDEAVRRALVQALDLDDVMTVVTGGTGMMPEGLLAYDGRPCDIDTVEGSFPDFDLDAARAALDQAGWLPGSDGVRVKDGQPLSLTLLYRSSGGENNVAATELMAQQWEEVGADVTLRPATDTEFPVIEHETGNWDVLINVLGSALPNILIPYFSGTPSPEGVNYARIDNPEYNSAVEQAMQLPGDEGCDLWAASERALFADADVVPLADNTFEIYMAGATFELGGNGIEPTTIRMLDE